MKRDAPSQLLVIMFENILDCCTTNGQARKDLVSGPLNVRLLCMVVSPGIFFSALHVVLSAHLRDLVLLNQASWTEKARKGLDTCNKHPG